MLLDMYRLKKAPSIGDKIYIYNKPKMVRPPSNTVRNSTAAIIKKVEFDDNGNMKGVWVQLCWHNDDKEFYINSPLDHFSPKNIGS